MSIRVRTSRRELLHSRAMKTCLLFVMVCVPFLLFFLFSMEDSEGTWRTLYGVAAAAPGFGTAVAVVSMAVVWWRRRQAVLIIDGQVRIPGSGVEFPLSELRTVQLWSGPGPTSSVALLPAHVTERAQRDGVRPIAPYVVSFPKGSTPRPFELVELLLELHPDLGVERLGVLSGRR
ncbi:hypothetical protein [Corynebacterium pacaense]|uniref:hypothetical protein n=1 Tax=Corynebacterium pacaense TaxID=1816684 RepID=UPI0009B9C7B3|nr:hypothetical protein [Corynebacterium pacaense]